ncbi:MAG: DUF4256 domain-containing protein [Flavobacterium sp.]|nr:DUF4256 domain-containing protein [Flavobacterium sp.]
MAAKAAFTAFTSDQAQQLLQIVESRFNQNLRRHPNIEWTDVKNRLDNNPKKLWSVNEMERSGGEPDIVVFDENSNELFMVDCSAESPAGRRSVCYDRDGLDSRKEHKPKDNAVDMATRMGIELLTEEQYRSLQKYGPFDTKTSSWILTPAKIRDLGGALFGDYRYKSVFIYHNGAQSYYGARGFRGVISI